MNLFLLQPTTEGSDRITYDCAVGFVVRAETEEAARDLVASSDVYGGEGSEFWRDPKLSECAELARRGSSGILLRSFMGG